MLLYIKHLFQLIISPGRGWEDIGHADSDPRRLLLNGLLPWLAVVALTSFCRGLYTQTFDYSAINAIIYALVIFVSYFLAYFIAPMAMSFFIDSFTSASDIERRLSTVVAYSTGLLAMIAALENSMPSSLTLMHFLPIYVAIIIWKATPYLEIKTESTGAFMILAILSIIAPPYLLRLALGLLV